jgi:hypothetical protein
MQRTIRGVAAAAVLLTVLTAGSASAEPHTAAAGTTGGHASSTPPPCGTDDVSFYFGGYTGGIGQQSFDITLLAHDGISCSLSDTPRVTLQSPPDQTTAVPVHINGRGGTLVLRPDSPLHTTVFYALPDTEDHVLKVSGLRLAMPDGSADSTYFLVPGPSDVNSDGVNLTSWTTGLGLGQAETAP